MFTEQDFRERLDKVKASMAEARLGALVIYDDNRQIGGGSARYLTNYYPLFASTQLIVIITPSDITLCVVPGLGNSGFAAAKQVCPPWVNIVGTRMGLWGVAFGKDIRNALVKAKVTGGKIGVEGFGGMPAALNKTILEELKDYQLVEDTGILDKLRLIKSPKEFEAIREAIKLADSGVTTFIASLKKGEPQYLAMSKAESVCRLAGAEMAWVFMGVGAPWIWGQYPSHRIYQEGDTIAFEFNARIHGYYGQVNRTFVIGTPTEKHKEVYKIAYDSYKAMEAIIKPGITAAELYKAGADVITKAGYEKPPRQGHGMGLTIAEGFEIDEHDNTVIQPGCFVMLHTMVTILDKGICATAGNPILVHEKSVELVSKAPYPM